MPLAARWWAALAAAAIAFPAQGAAPGPAAPNAYTTMVASDGRIQFIGWRLALANAPYCTDTRLGIGLLLQDAASWQDPVAARAALGLRRDIAVGAAATGSPAWRAGLTPGMAILQLDGEPLPAALVDEGGDYRRLADLHDRIDAALDRSGAVGITIEPHGQDRRTVTIAGELVCASRFEQVTDGDAASADGARVLVSGRFARSLPEDEQLAAAIAHELAHNLLRHPQKRREEGKSWGRIRHNEREADRLSVWLLANAGYPDDAAVHLMQGWGRRHDLGFLVPTHDAWDERVKAMEEERALVAALAADGAVPGRFDWSSRFPMSREEARP